jgi:2-iminobutanoate/2-iminopropanoate deaminase
MTNLSGLPYTPAVAAGDWVVISGQLGVHDGALVADFVGEVDQAIANLTARLADHGLGLEHLVKTTCFMADLDQFEVFNERYAAAMPEPRPARSTFQVAKLPLGANIEIEAWAYRGER